MKSFFWKFFCITLYCTITCAPLSLKSMEKKHANLSKNNQSVEIDIEKLKEKEQGNDSYDTKNEEPDDDMEIDGSTSIILKDFTTKNTQVAIITAESIADFIRENQTMVFLYHPNIRLKDLIQNLNLKSSEKTIAKEY